jgi:hypothetical protein
MSEALFEFSLLAAAAGENLPSTLRLRPEENSNNAAPALADLGSLQCFRRKKIEGSCSPGQEPSGWLSEQSSSFDSFCPETHSRKKRIGPADEPT